MRSFFHLVTGFAAFGFIGFFAASVFGICIGLVVAFWREGIHARVYYGIMAVPALGAIIYFCVAAVQNLLSATSANLPEVGLSAGFLAGLANFLRVFSRRKLKASLRTPAHKKQGRMQAIVDRSIFVLSWISILMLLIDLIFIAPMGAFLVNFTWLSETGLILYVIALVLLAVRRVFLKQKDEPKWNMERK